MRITTGYQNHHVENKYLVLVHALEEEMLMVVLVLEQKRN